MLNYILEVNLCWFGFYLLYSLVLSKETFFEYNRWYLLGGLISGLVIPLVEYQIIIEQIAEVPAIAGLDLASLAGMESTAVVVEEMDYRDWLLKGAFIIYCLGALILGLRFIFGLARIAFLYLHGSKQARPGYALVKTASVHPPFSFFHWLFQSQQIPLDKADEEKIITHEIEHIRQWHSLDVLLVELIGIVLWFSPLVWLYRRSLRMIHEYQADEAVLQTTKRKTYGHLLIRQSMSGPPIAIANHFIHSQLKKRLTMMTKKKSTQQSLIKYTFILPLLALFLMAFAPNKVYKVVTPETTSISLEDPGPDLDKIKKALSAILAKRAYAKTNMDGKIAGKFAETYDEYINSFPTHKKEITTIAVLVADQYEMDTKVVDDQLQSGQFREPFKKQTLKEGLTIVKEEKSDNTVGNIIIRDKATQSLTPLYIIDGKVSTKTIVDVLDPNDIATINVFKGEKAEAVYGVKGANGVVEIHTKGSAGELHEVKEDPLYIIDGKVSTKTIVDALAPNDIATINVFKGKKAEAVYGVEGANGVVEIHTKGSAGGLDEVKEELQQDKNIDASEKTTFTIKTAEDASVKAELDKEHKPTIKIRSTTSENDKQPLFVVDDEIFERNDGSPGELKDLDPNDIASINVLKDQSATAKYGQRGINGVVEIYNKGYKKEGTVDQMPRFGGCEEAGSEKKKNVCSKTALFNYITSNMKYPKAAAKAGVEGRVIVGFTVKKNGKVVDPKIESGSKDTDLQQEALRMVKMMPNWTPGLLDGKAVDVEMKLPFNFALGNDHKETVQQKPVLGDKPTTLPTPSSTLRLDNFKLTPNPNNGQMVVDFQASKSPVLIQIFDVKGQEVYKEYLPNFAGNYRQTISLDNVAKGPHVLSVTQNKQRFTTQFVTQ